jgi:hypothetical protein
MQLHNNHLCCNRVDGNAIAIQLFQRTMPHLKFVPPCPNHLVYKIQAVVRRLNPACASRDLRLPEDSSERFSSSLPPPEHPASGWWFRNGGLLGRRRACGLPHRRFRGCCTSFSRRFLAHCSNCSSPFFHNGCACTRRACISRIAVIAC